MRPWPAPTGAVIASAPGSGCASRVERRLTEHVDPFASPAAVAVGIIALSISGSRRTLPPVVVLTPTRARRRCDVLSRHRPPSTAKLRELGLRLTRGAGRVRSSGWYRASAAGAASAWLGADRPCAIARPAPECARRVRRTQCRPSMHPCEVEVRYAVRRRRRAVRRPAPAVPATERVMLEASVLNLGLPRRAAARRIARRPDPGTWQLRATAAGPDRVRGEASRAIVDRRDAPSAAMTTRRPGWRAAGRATQREGWRSVVAGMVRVVRIGCRGDVGAVGGDPTCPAPRRRLHSSPGPSMLTADHGSWTTPDQRVPPLFWAAMSALLIAVARGPSHPGGDPTQTASRVGRRAVVGTDRDGPRRRPRSRVRVLLPLRDLASRAPCAVHRRRRALRPVGRMAQGGGRHHGRGRSRAGGRTSHGESSRRTGARRLRQPTRSAERDLRVGYAGPLGGGERRSPEHRTMAASST